MRSIFRGLRFEVAAACAPRGDQLTQPNSLSLVTRATSKQPAQCGRPGRGQLTRSSSPQDNQPNFPDRRISK